MKKFLLIVICFFPVICLAQKSERCGFTIQCKSEKQDFSITFDSPSNDCTNDDQEIYLEANGEKTKLQLPTAWYFDIDNVGNQTSYCKSRHYEYPSFPLTESQFLIILRSNNRPHYDEVIAAIIDVSKAKVLDYQILGESQKESTGILVSGKKFRIQLIKEYLKEMRCDCDAAFVEGWMEFQAIDGKIQKNWLKN